MWTPSNTSVPWPTHHLKQQLYRCMHFRTTMQQRPHWLQWDAQNSLPKLPFTFNDYHPHLIHLSLDWPHSPSETSSVSNQPFCHNTLCKLTDRPTDRWARRQVRNISASLAMLIREQCAKKWTIDSKPLTVLTMEWRLLKKVPKLLIYNNTLRILTSVVDFFSQSHSTCSSVAQMCGTMASGEVVAMSHLYWELESSVCLQTAGNWQSDAAKSVIE